MELGLHWASSGLSCSISAYETTSAHLCHSSATGPRPLLPPPAFTSSLFPLFHCFKCKINIKFHSCVNIRPIQCRVGAEKKTSGFPRRTVVFQTRTCSRTDLPVCTRFKEWKGKVNAFKIVFIWGLILSHLLPEPSVYTLPFFVNVLF